MTTTEGLVIGGVVVVGGYFFYRAHKRAVAAATAASAAANAPSAPVYGGVVQQAPVRGTAPAAAAPVSAWDFLSKGTMGEPQPVFAGTPATAPGSAPAATEPPPFAPDPAPYVPVTALQTPAFSQPNVSGLRSVAPVANLPRTLSSVGPLVQARSGRGQF
jgi:hypothetical protein